MYSKQNEITLPLDWHLWVCYLQRWHVYKVSKLKNAYTGLFWWCHRNREHSLILKGSGWQCFLNFQIVIKCHLRPKLISVSCLCSQSLIKTYSSLPWTPTDVKKVLKIHISQCCTGGREHCSIFCVNHIHLPGVILPIAQNVYYSILRLLVPLCKCKNYCSVKSDSWQHHLYLQTFSILNSPST